MRWRVGVGWVAEIKEGAGTNLASGTVLLLAEGAKHARRIAPLQNRRTWGRKYLWFEGAHVIRSAGPVRARCGLREGGLVGLFHDSIELS